MKVVMTVNLGSRDAAKYELDFSKCTEGAEIDVPDADAEDLVKRRFARMAGIEAVPDESSISGVETKPKKKS